MVLFLKDITLDIQVKVKLALIVIKGNRAQLLRVELHGVGEALCLDSFWVGVEVQIGLTFAESTTEPLAFVLFLHQLWIYPRYARPLPAPWILNFASQNVHQLIISVRSELFEYLLGFIVGTVRVVQDFFNTSLPSHAHILIFHYILEILDQRSSCLDVLTLVDVEIMVELFTVKLVYFSDSLLFIFRCLSSSHVRANPYI